MSVITTSFSGFTLSIELNFSLNGSVKQQTVQLQQVHYVIGWAGLEYQPQISRLRSNFRIKTSKVISTLDNILTNLIIHRLYSRKLNFFPKFLQKLNLNALAV